MLLSNIYWPTGEFHANDIVSIKELGNISHKTLTQLITIMGHLEILHIELYPVLKIDARNNDTGSTIQIKQKTALRYRKLFSSIRIIDIDGSVRQALPEYLPEYIDLSPKRYNIIENGEHRILEVDFT